MLYHLFDYIENTFDFPGAGVFQFITFRAAMAVIGSLIISLIFGGRIIRLLQRLQVGETVRDLGLDGQIEKQGTPTMGGLMILAAIIIPTLLFARLDNLYIQLLLISTVWLGGIGFLDDYIKVFKKNKEGLAGKFKVVGQIGIGVIIGATLYFSDDVVIKEKTVVAHNQQELFDQKTEVDQYEWTESKGTKTTIPFVKNNEFDYKWMLSFLGDKAADYAWLIFIPAVIFIVTAVSNGANLTDGIDGLAAGTASIAVLTLGLFAWVSGNIIFADYLNVMYIPEVSEVVVFVAAFVGALVGFLWYNAFPAQVFMGDTGSLTIGGVIAVLALIVRKELLIPVLCGVFLIENLSVILQVSYFKYTKKRQGVGKRIFKMAPLHHHYQKLGYHESKIVSRFWIIAIMLAIISLVTLKIR